MHALRTLKNHFLLPGFLRTSQQRSCPSDQTALKNEGFYD